MTPDIINGLFEACAAALLLFNVRRVLKDKMVRGIHWLPTTFFPAWGLWNLFYYPSLDQWFSFAGGACVVLVNIVWLGLMFRYRNN